MARYKIIDEPNLKSWGEQIIVNPIMILFAAFFVPLFWDPPLLGRFWIPAGWLIVNGVALGSASLKQEIKAIVLGALAIVGMFALFGMLSGNGVLPWSLEDAAPYLRLVLFGIFFLTLYGVVFRQCKSYELFAYIHRGEQ